MKIRNLGEVKRLNENEPGPKISKYFEKSNDGKLVLRKAMKRYTPKEVTDREKQGFSAPDASWFRGESIEYVRIVLLNDSAFIYNFLDSRTVYALVNEHLAGHHNRRLLIWLLLCVE